MKEKINKRWGMKLLSLLCAFLVWLGVVNVADPVVTETVEVPVEIENEEILTANDLTYEIIGKKTATISYEVKTTNAYRIRPADFRAYADMTELWSVTGSIPIQVEVLNHAEYLEGNPTLKTSTIKIETEPLQKKKFDLASKVTGEAEDGYEVGEVSLSSSYVYVEGPESLIGQISSAGIEINVEGATEDLEGSAEIQFYDANGNRITLSERIESDTEQVQYKVTVLKVKNVSLDFQVTGQVASGYRYTGVECPVQSVPLVGLKSTLASLNTITIPGEELDITGARGNVVKTINLNEYLPESVTIAGSAPHEIQVTILVERLVERSFTVDSDEINLTGKDSELVYEPSQASVTVRIRALSEDLDSLELSGSDLTVDVSSMTEGTHTVRPRLELGDAYDVVSIPEIEIKVTKVSDGPGEEESSQAAGQTQAAAGTETEGSQQGTEGSGNHQLVPPHTSAAAGETEAVEAGSGTAESGRSGG